jgi:hypothetical protein
MAKGSETKFEKIFQNTDGELHLEMKVFYKHQGLKEEWGEGSKTWKNWLEGSIELLREMESKGSLSEEFRLTKILVEADLAKLK